MAALYSSLLLMAVIASGRAQLANHAAAEKGVGYLWSQLDTRSRMWPSGEVAPAILGFIAHSPPLENGMHSNETERRDIQVNLAGLASEFQARLLNPEPGKSTGSLANIDTPSLVQYMGVLRVHCQNPTTYLGSYNLVAEALDRLDRVSSHSPTFGALMLAVCNANHDEAITKSHMKNLAKAVPTTGHRCPFCVEKASMNVMALVCLAHKAETTKVDSDFKNLRVLRGLIHRFTAYIDSVQDPDGGFGSLFATSVAVQAKLSTKVKTAFDIEKAWSYLRAAQKPDGSFGASITFTAIVIPALTGQTATDINRIKCQDDGKAKATTTTTGKITVAYELQDLVFSEQKFRGRLQVTPGQTLLTALQNYALENPTVFKLQVESNTYGSKIVAINDIANDPTANTFWFADEVFKNGTTNPASANVDKIVLREESEATYRMSYRPSSLSL